MTLLDTLIENSLEFASISASAYTTIQTVDDDDLASTTVGLATTTILNSIEVPEAKTVQTTNEMSAYIETMSIEEIDQGLKYLDEKGLEFLTIETSSDESINTECNDTKVLIKTPKQP